IRRRHTRSTRDWSSDVCSSDLTAPLMLIALYSPKGSYDGVFLANYGYINLFDQLTRVPGIGNVQIFGAGQYAMRLWVKPDQLARSEERRVGKGWESRLAVWSGR